VIASSAFGMGINIPDISLVINWTNTDTGGSDATNKESLKNGISADVYFTATVHVA